jgi:hypothetical protein
MDQIIPYEQTKKEQMDMTKVKVAFRDILRMRLRIIAITLPE